MHFLYISGLVTATNWASLDLKLFIWDYFWAALPLRIICSSKIWFTTFGSIYLFPLTQTVIFQLARHQLANLTFFACILLEVLQTCPMWRDTEFPSMQGRRYALTQHAVQLQKADFTAAEKQNNLNSPCDILLWSLCGRLEISQCVFLSIVAWRVLDWKQRPGWQRGMSWCRRRTRLIIRTAMKLAKVRKCQTSYTLFCSKTLFRNQMKLDGLFYNVFLIFNKSNLTWEYMLWCYMLRLVVCCSVYLSAYVNLHSTKI